VPDLDNLVKFVLDALNEHLFVDDKQVRSKETNC
jgi:Holliday junction resolvase RusA-like endonuclease